MSDLETLKEMGFDEEKASFAVKKGGNLQGAIDWLERNQDKSIEELREDAAEEPDAPNIPVGESARSLVCKDCGKKFRSQAQAEFHASKSEHMNFEESTEEIAPLTEEEKKAKLEELRQKLAAKRAGQSEEDKLAKKRNEEISRKKAKDLQDIKEDLAKKEQIKEAQKKRQEKQADIEAKKRIKAKIEEDKEARRLKAEQEKAARAGQPVPVAAEPAAAPKPSAPKAAASYTEARLRLQTPNGTLQKTFPVETTLSEVAHAISQESGFQVSSFTTNFPKKTYDNQDFGQSLKEAGLVPSAALIVK
ncbi:hypothetical protein KVT40_001226 [Elsinoe batatas]|uniref:UBX domain-containing protein n=1 Tax=Elsinoe batatas TaxID=2601811 RepID=A0A8K0PJE1_9PEZI|nr:hypothetical protein KVT40_001226 [Elsinoe batatas]